MRTGAPVLLVLLVGGCSVYEGVDVTSGGADGATNPATAGGDTTRTSRSGGGAGTDIGAAGGVPAGSGGNGSGGTGSSGIAGAGTGGWMNQGGGGVATSSGPAGAGTSGAGGTSGRGGAAGGFATGGSGGFTGSSGTGGRSGIADAGADAAAVCQPGTCKRVFVSLNVPAPSGRLGGTAAVDAFCQSAADAARLGGTWRAWLSDGGSSPSTRFSHSMVPYRLLDGSLIANDWNGLTSGTIAHPINIFENGTPVPPSVVHEVWTGTTTRGTYSGNSCSSWTNDTMSSSITADVGLTNQVGTGWTDIYRQFCNRTTLHVFCLEQ